MGRIRHDLANHNQGKPVSQLLRPRRHPSLRAGIQERRRKNREAKVREPFTQLQCQHPLSISPPPLPKSSSALMTHRYLQTTRITTHFQPQPHPLTQPKKNLLPTNHFPPPLEQLDPPPPPNLPRPPPNPHNHLPPPNPATLPPTPTRHLPPHIRGARFQNPRPLTSQ